MASVFKALDTHGKGYLYKGEILEPIYDQGVQNHHTLDELIKGKLLIMINENSSTF